jgi:hypothetical protein
VLVLHAAGGIAVGGGGPLRVLLVRGVVRRRVLLVRGVVRRRVLLVRGVVRRHSPFPAYSAVYRRTTPVITSKQPGGAERSFTPTLLGLGQNVGLLGVDTGGSRRAVNAESQCGRASGPGTGSPRPGRRIAEAGGKAPAWNLTFTRVRTSWPTRACSAQSRAKIRSLAGWSRSQRPGAGQNG